MPAQIRFSVAQSEGATSHAVAFAIPTFAEATAAQRQVMWDEGVSSVTIKVQGTLRRRLAKGVRGEALNVEGKAAFDSILNGTPRAAVAIVIDLNKEEFASLTAAQVAGLRAAGALVIDKVAK